MTYNMIILRIILIFTTRLLPSALGERCSAEYCNFAGDCTVVAKKPTCQCYAETFHGEYCEKIKDLCLTDTNICKDHKSCIPYVGQTICNCQQHNSGFDCRHKKGINPTKVMCSFNVRVVYGQQENILLSFEEMGSEAFQIDISTYNLMIANALRSDRSSAERTLRHTSNFTATLTDLGIRMHTRPPYNDAHYYVFSAKYFELGKNILRILIKSVDSNNDSKSYYKSLSLVVHVVQPFYSKCLPKIVFQHGMDPNRPRPVQLDHFCNIQAIVERSCSNQYTTQWSIYDIESKICYYTSNIEKNLLFKIPRYELQYKHLKELVPDKVLVVVLAYNESSCPLLYIRCYIWITVKNVIARITGGDYREVNSENRLILDGSQSRDPMRTLNEDQLLLYSWTISAADGSNTSEKSLAVESLDPMLSVSSDILERDAKYLITLTVAHKTIKSRSTSAIQVIRVVRFKPLSIDIECIRNCQSNLFNINHSLHLRAVCYECVKPVYTWTMNGVTMNQDKERLVADLKSDIGEEIIVELDVADRYSKAHTEIKLNISKPPTGGHCTIEPKTGEECSTKFKIHCVDYISDGINPLLYVFKLGTIYADYSNSPETFLYLNEVDKLTVHICNEQFVCTVEELNFSVTPMSDFDMNTLVMLKDMGQRQKVICILQKLSTAPEQIEYMEKQLKRIENDTARTMIEMINTLEIAYSFIKSLRRIEHQEAHILSYLISRIISTFNIINEDTEILDMPRQMCLNMGNVLTDIVGNLCILGPTHLEGQEIPSDFEHPFNDQFSDWTEFDTDIIHRIGRYSKLVRLIFDLWKLIGSAATHHIQSNDNYEYATAKFNYKLMMHEQNTKISYTSHDFYCKFEVPMSTVATLRKTFQTKALLIQTWCFHQNIFWWVPQIRHPTTAILAVNIYAQNGKDVTGLEATENNLCSLSVRNLHSNVKQTTTQTDVLHRSLVVYKLQLRGQANLIVQFFNASKSLRVMVKLNVEPTLFNLYDTNCFVPMGRERTIVLRNRCPKKSTAYIAVYRANYLDFSHVTYSYSLRAHECCVWNRNNENPHWSRSGCYSKNTKHHTLYSQYYVNQFSVFSAKDYSVKSHHVPTKITFVKDLPVNMSCVLFTCLMVFGTLALLFIGRSECVSNQNLVRVIQLNRDEVHPRTENVIVHIHTGSMKLAFTTANIQLIFKSDLGRYKVVVYQNPCKPQLGISTSCLLRLSDEKVQLPCRLTISHDNTGRNPTWYCRAIQIDDLRRDLSYTFPIYRWIKGGQKVKVSCYRSDVVSDKHKENKNTRWTNFIIRFRHYIKLYFINWYMLQPILGPWHHTDNSCNTFKRICIWSCKIILTITLIFCYYRNTTHVNYYDYEQQSSGTSTVRILALAIGCYLATVIYDMILTIITRT